MSEPKIVKSKVDISFSAESGYSSKCGLNSKNSDAMIDAIRELSSMLHIEGRGDEAIAAAQMKRYASEG